MLEFSHMAGNNLPHIFLFRKNFLIVLILILAASLRFFQLGQNPPSLDWDETAHGYNAYSISRTQRDEYGYKFPLYFRSFDDYKPPLYTYLVVPSVAIFGLNDFAVRFPSALLGIFAVLFTYLMVYELLKKKKLALLAGFLLAISPWHLQFSRVAFETNSAIFWLVLATWAYLKGIKSEGWRIIPWMALAAFAFGANLYMYHNARVFVPLFGLMLAVLFKDFVFKNIKYLFIPFVIFSIFVIFLIPIATSTAGQLRFKGTTIFADVTPQYKTSEKIAQDEKSNLLPLGRLVHNRRFVYVPILVDNYLSHLKPTYLFFTADMDRHHAPLVGLLYLWELPFLLAGIYFLISKNFEKRSKIIIFSWFLLAPIASSVTWGVPHSLRSEIYLPTFQIFTAIGIFILLGYLREKKYFLFPALGIFFFNFFFYLHQYYIHMPTEFSKAWLYGRKEAVKITEKLKGEYAQVIVSTKLEQPHEFWLYYSKYPPQKYLEEGGTVSGGYLEDRNKFDKYLFKPLDYKAQKLEAKTLFVSTAKELPQNANVIDKIYYLNGEQAIYIFD